MWLGDAGTWCPKCFFNTTKPFSGVSFRFQPSFLFWNELVFLIIFRGIYSLRQKPTQILVFVAPAEANLNWPTYRRADVGVGGFRIQIYSFSFSEFISAMLESICLASLLEQPLSFIITLLHARFAVDELVFFPWNHDSDCLLVWIHSNTKSLSSTWRFPGTSKHHPGQVTSDNRQFFQLQHFVPSWDIISFENIKLAPLSFCAACTVSSMCN